MLLRLLAFARTQVLAVIVAGTALLTLSPACAAERAPAVDLHGDPLPPGAIARMGTVRFRSGETISCVAVSPNGRTIASGGGNDVLLWDAATGRCVRRLKGHDGEVRALAYSADGRLLASAGGDGTTRLWRTDTGATVRRVGGRVQDGDRSMTAVAISPDGALLATAQWMSGEGGLRLWDMATGKELRRWGEAGSRMVNHLAFSPDGKTLASGGGQNDRTLRLWDVPTGRLLHQCGDRSERVYGLGFTPDGKTLVSGRYTAAKAICVWDVATGKERCSFPGDPGGAWLFALSPDGKLVASLEHCYLSMKWALRLREAATGREVRRCEPPLHGLHCLVFSPDGKRLIGGGDDAEYQGKIRVWEVVTGQQILPIEEHQAGVHALALSHDGQRLASVGGDGVVRLWETGTGRPLGRLAKGTKYVVNLAFSPDDRLLATTGNPEEEPLRVWTVAGGKELRRFGPRGTWFWSVLFSPDGKQLVTRDDKGLVRIWDPCTGKELRSFRPKADLVGSLALSGDGRTLATTSSTVRLWDFASGRLRTELPGNELYVWAATFSADGRILAAGDGGGNILLWELRTGKELHRIGGQGHVEALAFARDGRTLFSAARSSGPSGSVIRSWEVLTGRERLPLPGHQGQVTALVVSGDGSTLASASRDSTILLWALPGRRTDRTAAERLTTAELDALGAALAGEDAARAQRAQVRLAASPVQALAWLRGRLRPVPAVGPAQLERWIKELEDRSFAVRERAVRNLQQQGTVAEAALKAALTAGPTLEAARRIESLLGRLAQRPPAGWAFQVRAVELLEWLAVSGARTLLDELAAGAPQARLTQESRESVERLSRGKQ